MRAVIDTNVWVSALIRPTGAPGAVLRAAAARRFVPLANWPLADELVRTLTSRRLRRYRPGPQVRQVLALLGSLLPDVTFKVDLRDPDDVAVVHAAIASNADAIVSGDRDLLDDAALRAWLADRGTEVLTPAEFLARLGE